MDLFWILLYCEASCLGVGLGVLDSAALEELGALVWAFLQHH